MLDQCSAVVALRSKVSCILLRFKINFFIVDSFSAKRLEKQPRFKKSPSDVRTVEGETLTLEAEVEGVPTPEIVWSLDGEEILNGDVSYQNNVAR